MTAMKINETVLIYIGLIILTGGLAQASVNVSGSIAVDTTFGLTSPAADGIYIVTDNLTVQGGATLTIEPGVELRFDQSRRLTIGGATSPDPGFLSAQGVSGSEIRFTSNQVSPSKADWAGIIFTDEGDDSSVLDHCIVEYTGSTGFSSIHLTDASPTISNTELRECYTNGIYMLNASPTVTTCSIHDNNGYGAYLQASSPVFTDTIIESNGMAGGYLINDSTPSFYTCSFIMNQYGLQMFGAADLPIVDGCTFTSNTLYQWRGFVTAPGGFTNNTYGGIGNQEIRVQGTAIALDATWEEAVPYRVAGSVTVKGSDGLDGVTTLTLEPGVTYMLSPSSSLIIGDGSNPAFPGALSANGDALNKITFTSGEAVPAAGDWHLFHFSPYSDDTLSVLNHCIVEYGNQSLVVFDASPLISNTEISWSLTDGMDLNSGSEPVILSCEFTNNTGYGLNNDSTGYPTVSGCSFTNNGSEPVNCYPQHLGGMTGNTYTGNGIQEIRVMNGDVDLDATWEDPGIPYQINANVDIEGTDGLDGVTTVTIEAGAELRFNSFGGLSIGHTSNAALPGALIAAGDVANPITFTSSAAMPAPGSWQGVVFDQFSDDSLCKLDYCIAEYGGASNTGNIRSYYANPVVSNTVSRYSGSSGFVSFNASPVITDCDITDNVTGGFLAFGNDGLPLISGCNFQDNGSYAINARANQVGGFAGNTFSGNADPGIYVSGGTISLDATWDNVPAGYVFGFDILIQGMDGGDGATTLTLGPGITIQVEPSHQLIVGNSFNSALPGGLMVNGTPGSPVVFTSSETSPAPGDWDGIRFNNYAGDSLCILTNCIVEYGGYYEHNLYCYNSSPTFDHVTSRNGVIGVYCQFGGSPTIHSCLIENNTDQGIFVNGTGSDPVITNSVIMNQDEGIRISDSTGTVIGGAPGLGNNIMGNLTFGAQNTTASVCVDASYNYWGDSAGPYDTDSALDGCMNSDNINPPGDSVSEDVLYANWLTAPIDTPTSVPTATATPTITPTLTVTPTPTTTGTPAATSTPKPIPATGPAGVGLLIIILSSLIAISAYRRRIVHAN